LTACFIRVDWEAKEKQTMFTDQKTKALNELAALVLKYEEEFKAVDIMRYLDDALLDGQHALEISEELDAEHNVFSLSEHIYQNSRV